MAEYCVKRYAASCYPSMDGHFSLLALNNIIISTVHVSKTVFTSLCVSEYVAYLWTGVHDHTTHVCEEVRDWVLSAITLYFMETRFFLLNPGLLFSQLCWKSEAPSVLSFSDPSSWGYKCAQCVWLVKWGLGSEDTQEQQILSLLSWLSSPCV